MAALTTRARKRLNARLFATPTAGDVVKRLYAATRFEAVRAIKDAGWDADFTTFDTAFIASARNYSANLLLRQPSFTHLVMIDGDMSFNGHIVCRLLRSEKPVVAGAYSRCEMMTSSVPYAETGAVLFRRAEWTRE